MELIANITGAVKSVLESCERAWMAEAMRLNPRLCALLEGGGCVRGGTVHLLVKVAAEIGQLLYREAASRVDPGAVSALVRASTNAYKVLKFLVPWSIPWIARLVRYLREPAVTRQPRHDRHRSYGVMAERAAEHRKERQATRRLTSTKNHAITRAR